MSVHTQTDNHHEPFTPGFAEQMETSEKEPQSNQFYTTPPNTTTRRKSNECDVCKTQDLKLLEYTLNVYEHRKTHHASDPRDMALDRISEQRPHICSYCRIPTCRINTFEEHFL